MNLSIAGFNLAGTHAMGFAWNMLVQSSVLIAVLLAADRLLRRRVRAVVRYALLLLIPLKLILPPSLALPTGAGYWTAVGVPDRRAPGRALDAATPRISESVFTIADQPAAIQPGNIPRPNGSVLLLAFWLAGSIALTGWVWLRCRRFRRSIGADPASNPPAALIALLRECAEQLGLGRTVELRLVDSAESPRVWGLRRPAILLPMRLVSSLEPAELRAVLLHELAHVRRLDLWVNWAQVLVQIAYWWHPLVWLANARIRAVREEAVDETVCAVSAKEAEVYPEALLAVARLTAGPTPLALGFLGIVESRSALGRRVRRLLDDRFSFRPDLGWRGWVCFVVAALLLLPMARGQRAAPPPPAATPSAGSASAGEVKAALFDAWFLFVPADRVSEFIPPSPATPAGPGVRSHSLTAETLKTFLIKAEGAGGLMSGSPITFLPGKRKAGRLGDSVSIPIGTQAIGFDAEGRIIREARYLVEHPSGPTDWVGNRVGVIARRGGEGTRFHLWIQAGVATMGDDAGSLPPFFRGQSTARYFDLAADASLDDGSVGTLVVSDRASLPDGRICLAVIAATPVDPSRFNVVRTVTMLGGGRYRFEGQELGLDALHTVLGEQKDASFGYAVTIEPTAGATAEDDRLLRERLQWLRVPVQNAQAAAAPPPPAPAAGVSQPQQLLIEVHRAETPGSRFAVRLGTRPFAPGVAERGLIGTLPPQMRTVVLQGLGEPLGSGLAQLARVTTLDRRAARIEMKETVTSVAVSDEAASSRVEVDPTILSGGERVRLQVKAMVRDRIPDAAASPGAPGAMRQLECETIVELADGHTAMIALTEKDPATGAGAIPTKQSLLFVRATLIDPAGNQVRTEEQQERLTVKPSPVVP